MEGLRLNLTSGGITVVREEEASKKKVHNNKENKEISSDKEYKNNSGKLWLWKPLKINTYVLGIQGDSEDNVHIFGSYNIGHCDKTVQTKGNKVDKLWLWTP